MNNPYKPPSARQIPTKASKLGFWKVLFSINGRIPRSTYWLYSIFTLILFWGVIFYLDPEIFSESYNENDPFEESTLNLINTEAIEKPDNSNVYIKPIDSMNVDSVIIITSLVMYFWTLICISGKRWHDRDKSAWWILFQLVPLIGPIWTFIENGFLKGTHSHSRYGPDPT